MAALRASMALVIAAAFFRTALSANYVIGGTRGWDLGTNLRAWASAQSFQTGDNITFLYGSLHNVVEVSKAEFDACLMSNPIETSAGGNTVINLPTPGKRYFICGIPGHCSSGMKVEISTSPPLEAPIMAPSARSSPSFPPVRTPSPSMTPVTDLSETAPISQESSAANCFSQMVEIGLGLATSMMMLLF